MSSVIVSYGTKQARVKYTPGTLLSEIKTKACNAWSLDPLNYELKRNNLIINESLPFRLSNLVANSKLDLVVKRNAKGKAATVKIKISVIDLPASFSDSLVGEFANSMTIWQILKRFERKSGINFTDRSIAVGANSSRMVYELPSVHLFNRTISKLEELNSSLSSLGLSSGNVSIKVRFTVSDLGYEEALEIIKGFVSEEKEDTLQKEKGEGSNQQESKEIVKEVEKQVEVDDKIEIDEPDNISEDATTTTTTTAQPTSRPINVYLPSNTPLKFDSVDEPEMTVRQFAHYHNQIKAMSEGSSNRPLMTKALRDLEESKKVAKITEHTVRIRLPDQSHVETVFLPTDKMVVVYEFVKSVLKDEKSTFKLSISPPRQVLNPELSLKEYKFGQRNLVFLEWDNIVNSKEPLLKQEYLSIGKPILEDPGVKKDQQEEVNKGNDSSSSSSSSNQNNTTTSKKILNSTPKWLKLSKK